MATTNAPAKASGAPAPRRSAPIRAAWADPRVRAVADAALVVAVGIICLRVFQIPARVHDFAFPVGSDVSVYLWWSREAAGANVSLAGGRPGIAVVIPTVGALLDVGLVPAVAGVQYALGPAVGLAAAALARGRGTGSRVAWVTGGVLAGVWATHMGDGYIANLGFAATFLAAGSHTRLSSCWGR